MHSSLEKTAASVMMGGAVMRSSVLAFGFQAKRELAVHSAHRIPVEADMASHCVGITPCALHRIGELESEAAGGGVERFARLHREFDREGLAAPAFDAFFHTDLTARAHGGGAPPQIAQQNL